MPAFAAIVLVGSLFSYIRWKRLTYTVGEQDIRVESGVLTKTQAAKIAAEYAQALDGYTYLKF